MARVELEHFTIGNSYGGNQDWFRTFMMRIGGCAAETACDSSLYFALHRGLDGVYPFDKAKLTKADYVAFAHRMEQYLWPRMSGVNRLELFIDGYAKCLKDCGVEVLSMTAFDGSEPYEKAADVLRRQIDAGYPVPTLILNHRDKAMKDYVWHWFLINGYDRKEDADDLLVKAVSYSEFQWLSLRQLWNTGRDVKGGFVLYKLNESKEERHNGGNG